jgi:hypothetical protein
MPREIELIFPQSNVRITAELLEDQAPKTCQAVWSVLPDDDTLEAVKDWPEKGRVHHGIYAGPELYVFIPRARERPPIENLTYHPIPGDIMLVIVPETTYRWVDVKGELWDFAIFYDRGANLRTSGPEGLGWEGSRFAQVKRDDLDNLLKIGRKIRFQGEEYIVIRRKKE